MSNDRFVLRTDIVVISPFRDPNTGIPVSYSIPRGGVMEEVHRANQRDLESHKKCCCSCGGGNR